MLAFVLTLVIGSATYGFMNQVPSCTDRIPELQTKEYQVIGGELFEDGLSIYVSSPELQWYYDYFFSVSVSPGDLPAKSPFRSLGTCIGEDGNTYNAYKAKRFFEKA